MFVATFIGENNIVKNGENYVAVRPENVKVRSVEEPILKEYHLGHIEDIEFVGNMEKLYVREEKTSELLWHIKLLKKQRSGALEIMYM